MAEVAPLPSVLSHTQSPQERLVRGIDRKAIGLNYSQEDINDYSPAVPEDVF